MTVANTVRVSTYTGNGVTVSFPVVFSFFEIAVYVDDALQTNGGSYYITQSEPGATGNVVFFTAPASNTAIRIIGDTDLVQETDYVDNDPFGSEEHERALDRLTMIVQELRRDVDDAIDEIAQDTTPLVINSIIVLPTRATIAATSIDSTVYTIWLTGYSAANDGGGAFYKRIVGTPSPVKAWHVQSSDGTYWQLDEPEPTPQMFGAKGDAPYGVGVGTDDTTAVDNWFSYALTFQVKTALLKGRYRYKPTAPWNVASQNWGLNIRGRSWLNDGFALDATYELAIEGSSFYWAMRDFHVIGSRSGPVFRVGKDDYSDAHNVADMLGNIKNTSSNASAEAFRLNYVLHSDIDLIGNGNASGRPGSGTEPGTGTAAMVRQVQFSSLRIGAGNANKGLVIASGFTYANDFLLDIEEVDKGLTISTANATNNEFGGVIVATTLYDCTAGSRNIIDANVLSSFYGGGSTGTNLVGIEIRDGAIQAHITTPSLPATTVYQANTTGKKVQVVMWGGTYTVVTIKDATGGAIAFTPGITNGTTTFTLLPNWSIAVTYASPPGWAWFPA